MNKYKILSLVLLIWITLGSCEKLLEEGKDNQYTQDRALLEPRFAEGILLSAYRSIPNSYTIDEVATDDAVSNDKSDNFLRMATGEWTSMNNPMNKWSSAYDAIFNINYFLSIIDEVPWSWQSDLRKELFRNRFEGEALGLRAYFYYQLLMSHGGVGSDGALLGVPLVTELLEIDDNWSLPRASFQQCIDQINADLDAAIAKLPLKWEDKPNEADYNRVLGKQNLNRINGTIAKAIKSKVALLAASPAFNSSTYNVAKYAEAARLAGQAIVDNGGLTSLNAQGHLFFDDDNDPFLTEILWRFDHFNANTLEAQNFPPSLYGSGNVNPTQNLVDAFPMANGYPITDLVNSGYNALNPYANRDSRLKAYIVYDGNKIGNATINTDIADPKDGLNNSTDATRTGYYLLKLLRNNVNLNPTATNTRRHFKTHIRYTEIFLNYAEAANEAWGPDAKTEFSFSAREVIAAIRRRAGIPAVDPYLASITTPEAMRALIRNERRLELCFEGFRFWDLRRWEMNLTEGAKGISIDNSLFTVINVEDRVYESFMKFGPIPFNETLKYEGLLQNQGW